MQKIPIELINKASTAQTAIWAQVSVAISEAANGQLTFGSPLTVGANTSDLYAELSVPMLTIQFAFADTPDRQQAVLIPQDTALALAGYLKNAPVTEFDENLVSEIRAPLEAIVQGICVGTGSLKGETVVATNLAIRYQLVTLPSNLTQSLELVRTQIAVSGEDVNGTLIWLIDGETAAYILNEKLPDEDAESTVEVAQELDLVPRIRANEEGQGLDLLMDIPLELSVELGRVKMMVRDIVELGTGSIVEIEKAAGEPVDVLVNGRPVARGEVVVIEDNFGVRITEILSPQDRLTRLGEVA
ncbi:MAG TPA: flagellar motor switch protein FliN [Fimbriimonadaceae bacterium]|nr:flagellar motor switch protein FliN [Fimbriimonadaceae bacterium]